MVGLVELVRGRVVIGKQNRVGAILDARDLEDALRADQFTLQGDGRGRLLVFLGAGQDDDRQDDGESRQRLERIPHG